MIAKKQYNRQVYIMKRALTLLVLMISVATPSFAVQVTSEMAQKAAVVFLQDALYKHQLSEAGFPSISGIRPLVNSSQRILAYVVEFYPSGFVVVSGDTDTDPVIAFSVIDSFCFEDSPENILLHMILTDVQERFDVATRTDNPISGSFFTSRISWHGFLSDAFPRTRPAKYGTVYGPLLKTAWHQGPPYNQFCPIDPVTGYRCSPGCSATALAQLCNYWKFPKSLSFDNFLDSYRSGWDSSTIHLPEDAALRGFPSYDELSRNLGDIKYSGEAREIAYLMFGIGVKIEASYHSGGSAASLSPDKLGFRCIYSKWSPAMLDTILGDVRSGRPVPLSVNTRLGRHSVIADGFDENTNSIHINYGWGPSTNTWYRFPVDGVYECFDIMHHTVPVENVIKNITRSMSPYNVKSDIVIESGTTLEIEPGVDVIMANGTGIQNWGILRAIGTPEDSIRFLPNGNDSWDGIETQTSADLAWVRISGVRAGVLRGAIATRGANVRMNHCVITGNDGGGIWHGGDLLYATNTTIARNTRYSGYEIESRWGSGMEEDRKSVLINCTIVGDGTDGRPIFYERHGDFVVKNCIIWGNGMDAMDADTRWPYLEVSYSNLRCRSGVFAGTGNININPLFEVHTGTYQLKQESPCVDAGDPALPLDPDGTRADIGAYYFPGGKMVAVTETRPAVFSLAQNAPNPFNPSTAIRFSIARAGNVRLEVYDVAGRRVRTLRSGHLAAGFHEVVWDGRDATGRPCASGAYVYRLDAGDGEIVRRMVLVR